MDFDAYDYLEKTVENFEPQKDKEGAVNGGGETEKCVDKDHSGSSKHRNEERDDYAERSSKRSRSRDELHDLDKHRERGSSHQRLRSRDGERDRHRSSWEHKDKERDKDRDRDREERNGKERNKDRDRERDRDRDRDRRERGHESEWEKERSHRSKSRSDRHPSERDERERSRDKEYKERERERELREHDRESRYARASRWSFWQLRQAEELRNAGPWVLPSIQHGDAVSIYDYVGHNVFITFNCLVFLQDYYLDSALLHIVENNLLPSWTI